MKRIIILIIGLIFVTPSFSQEKQESKNFIPKSFNKFNELTHEKTLELANEIGSLTRNDWVFLKERERKNMMAITLIKEELGPNIIEAVKNGNKTADDEDLLVITFDIKYKGANKDLEIEGAKVYSFKKVSGKYLDLFPFWKKEFNPDADVEKTLNDYNSREVVDKNTKAKFKLEEFGGSWRIYNWSF